MYMPIFRAISFFLDHQSSSVHVPERALNAFAMDHNGAKLGREDAAPTCAPFPCPQDLGTAAQQLQVPRQGQALHSPPGNFFFH